MGHDITLTASDDFKLGGYRADPSGKPKAAVVVIPAAGHAVNIDQPQAFIDAVVPFLDSLPAASGKRAAS